MIADIVGYVYCEHEIRTERPESEWPHRGRFAERTCMKRAEAVLRYMSYRGIDRVQVRSFTSFTSTKWTAWVDREGSGHVRCAEHRLKAGHYPSDIRSFVES